MESILLALNIPLSEKIRLLKNVSVKLNVLRINIRLAKEIKILNLNKYIILQKEINDIGKMLGNWINNSTQKEQ